MINLSDLTFHCLRYIIHAGDKLRLCIIKSRQIQEKRNHHIQWGHFPSRLVGFRQQQKRNADIRRSFFVRYVICLSGKCNDKSQ